MPKMNIGVIFTGGTISSVKDSNGVISPKNGLVSELDSFFYAHSRKHNFIFRSPFYALSENMTIGMINRIIETVYELSENSSGIIITHGTDTLAYSGAALSYALSGIGIPVIIVSSDYPLKDERALGIKNLENAVRFIKQKGGTGVFVAWGDNIHRASRLLAPIPYEARVRSILASVYGRFINGIFVKNSYFKESKDEIEAPAKLNESKNIAVFQPLINYKYPDITADAVLLLSYHSGTIDSNNPSLIHFCEKMQKNGTPIFLHGSYDGADYESKNAFATLGLKTLPIMSAPAAYMKLFALEPDKMSLSLGSDIIKEAVI